MPKTCVLIVLDGLGDRAHAQLGYRTPLEAADTPYLDKLASMGSNGLYHAGKLGQALPSENAHFVMFGSPMSEFPGRGPLEALGAGIPLEDNDVAMLAHFTSVLETFEKHLVLKYDRICGTPDETDALFNAVRHFEKDGIIIDLHQTGGMFGVLTLRGDASPHITDSNPMVDGRFISAIMPLSTHRDDPDARRTAAVLTDYLRWAYAQLREVEQNKLRVRQTLPPINGLVTQFTGQLCPRTSLRDRYGMHAISMASGFLYKGLSRFLGLDYHRVRDTRDPGKDLAGRIEHAISIKDEYDLIHIHTKAPDRAAHTKSPKAKVKAIESLDRGLAESIDPLLHEDVLLVITADQSTPSCGTLIHSGEPVPAMFIGSEVRRDTVTRFDEIHAAGGALSLMRGDEMMHMILNYMDRARLAGSHDAPHGQEFWPGDYDPFTVESD